MRYTELLEGVNSKCIVVDVQPAYMAWAGDLDVHALAEWLNKQGDILMFVNADETGMTEDTIPEIQEFWFEHEYDKFDDTEIVDKGYGYFRAWMDNGVSDAAIIRTVRELYAQKKTDTRELFGGDDSEEHEQRMQEMLGNEFEDWMIDDPLTVEWTSVGQLKKYNGAYLMGGGRDECLKEVMLLMNAFNIKYKLVQEFIYE